MGFRADGIADLPFLEESHHSAGSCQAVCAAAREADGMCGGDGGGGLQEVGFPCAGAATSHIHSHHGAGWQQRHGGARSPPLRGAVVVPEAEAGEHERQSATVAACEPSVRHTPTPTMYNGHATSR